MSNEHHVPHGNQRDFIANFFSNKMSRIPHLKTPNLGWAFANTFVFSHFPLQKVPLTGGASPCSLS